VSDYPESGTGPDACPVEAVFPDQSLPCLAGRGHEPPHKFTPEPCEQCGCLPGDTWGCGCSNEECPCSEDEDDDSERLTGEAFEALYAPGRRVRFTRPDGGYPADQEMAAALLTPGETYTIDWSDVGFTSTRIALAGVDSRGQGFNSVLFESVDEPEPVPQQPEEGQ
jgi:hypothetical protein